MNTSNFCKRKGLKGSYLIVQLHSNSINRADIFKAEVNTRSSCHLRANVQPSLQLNAKNVRWLSLNVLFIERFNLAPIKLNDKELALFLKECCAALAVLASYLEHVECQLRVVLPLLQGLLHIQGHRDRAITHAGSHVVEFGNLGQLLSKIPGRYLCPLCILRNGIRNNFFTPF